LTLLRVVVEFSFTFSPDTHDDGQCDHDHAGAAPHVLHEELLQHDVPQALVEDAVLLRYEGTIGRPQVP